MQTLLRGRRGTSTWRKCLLSDIIVYPSQVPKNPSFLQEIRQLTSPHVTAHQSLLSRRRSDQQQHFCRAMFHKLGLLVAHKNPDPLLYSAIDPTPTFPILMQISEPHTEVEDIALFRSLYAFTLSQSFYSAASLYFAASSSILTSPPTDFFNVIEETLADKWEDIFSPYTKSHPPPTSQEFILGLCLGSIWASHSTDNVLVESQLFLSSRNLVEALELIEREINFTHKNPYFEWLLNPETKQEDDFIDNTQLEMNENQIQEERQNRKRRREEREKKDKKEFADTQAGFAYAVENWPQALCAMIANIDNQEDRLPIIRNVMDKRGLQDTNTSHPATFHQFLEALGTKKDEEVPFYCMAFNSSINGVCKNSPVHVSAAMMGCIEHLYINISASLARTVVEREWTLPGDQQHNLAHDALGIGRANDLINLAMNYITTEEERIEAINGLFLGVFYFWNLYSDMSKAGRALTRVRETEFFKFHPRKE